MKRLITASNRSTDEAPLTMDMLTKSLFTCFLYREPVEDNITTEAYKRQTEAEHMVALLNMFYDLGLNSWNPKAASGDTNQRRLQRMFRSKSAMAWSEILRDAVLGKLDLDDADEREKPFYRELDTQKVEAIKKIVGRLFAWKFWSDAGDGIDRVLSDNKSEVKKWFKEHDLTPGYLMGASS